jgi:hypothetical protein
MPAEGSTVITSKSRLANHAASRPEPAPTSKARILVLGSRSISQLWTEAAERGSYCYARAGAWLGIINTTPESRSQCKAPKT